MIPKRMDSFLRQRLPDKTWENRLVRDNGLCYLEFSSLDIDRLARLGIEVDNIGPRVVVCLWDENSPLEVGGYLVVDNLSMGRPAIGGIRILPDLTPSTVHSLARGMTLKNAASNLPYGGGKVGIVAERSITSTEHAQIVKSFARLLYRYRRIFLPGPDVGTTDSDMKIIAMENGLDEAISKPMDMGGNRVDELGAAAGGLVIAFQALIKELPRLKELPQFSDLQIPDEGHITALIQGFGAVGAHTGRILCEQMPGVKIIGISDALGYLYDEGGLPITQLFKMWQERGSVTRQFFNEVLVSDRWGVSHTKYSSSPNDLLRESAFCLFPASPIANYLDLDASSQPSMIVQSMGYWRVIIEGANTYSPDKRRRAARSRMEREVYRNRGILIATDYLVNSGGVIYAAQEHLIKTPNHLRIPDEMLGNTPAVDRWLSDHEEEFRALADKRRKAARHCREEVIHRNMHELIDLLLSDTDLLPCEAAEKISIRRVASSERDRAASDIMIAIPTIPKTSSVRKAAEILVEATSPILAVVAESGELIGIVTEWDITRSTALGSPDDQPLEQIMTREVVFAKPADSILDMVSKLEHFEISAMPVVDKGVVLGMVTSDLLARRSLLNLLQSEALG